MGNNGADLLTEQVMEKGRNCVRLRNRVISGALVLVLVVTAGYAAETQAPPATLILDRTVHFTAWDGSDIQLPSGIYRVEQAGDGSLRLFLSGTEASVDVQATAFIHDESLTSTVALPVLEEGQEDEIHLVFLLPGGQGLDAMGSYSGVRSRAVGKALGRVQVHSAVNQSTAVAPKSGSVQAYAAIRVPSAAAAVTPPPASESVETSGPGTWVTWNYLYMHHPEIVAQALADVQTSKQPRASVAGLASEVELNDMLKTNWSAEVSRLTAMREAGVTQTGVTPRGLPDSLSLKDQVTAVPSAKTILPQALKPIAHDPFPIQLPPRNLGSVWAGQRATTVVSITAPADGYVEGRFDLNATNRHFRIVNAIAYTGELARGKALAVSLTIPGGQYQDVVPDPANRRRRSAKRGSWPSLRKRASGSLSRSRSSLSASV